MKNTTLITIVVTGVAIGVVGFATAQSRQPTKGYVPDKAFENGRINIDDVPDYFIAYARNGEVAGYIRKGDYFVSAGPRPKRIEVVDETLATPVGYMVEGRGFVPLGTPEEAIPRFETRSLTPEELDQTIRK